MYRFLLTRRWLTRLTVALVVATVMSLLGMWQLSRYETRAAINARIDAADLAAPLPLDAVVPAPVPGQDVGPAPPEDAVWSMVRATGRYDPAHEVLVRARSVQGRVGFEVVTPLVLADGPAVLVNRGWVPPPDAGIVERPDVPAPPDGEVTVVGRIRQSESRPRPVESHDGALQTRRITATQLAPHLPYPLHDGYVQLETQAPPADLELTPIPISRENALLNAAYAVQWWIFAGLVLGGVVWFARREARQRPETS